MLEIRKSKFLTSIKSTEDFTVADRLPKIAVSGKSNSGKSSLINYLCGNSKLAYVSKQPGKTRLINYFLLNDAFCLVDLPGYGFAKVSKAEKRSWSDMLEGYFISVKNLVAFLILVDIRREPGEGDLDMINWAYQYGIPFAVIATKADKVANSKRTFCVKAIQKKIIEALGMESVTVIAASAQKKNGKESVLGYIQHILDMTK